MCQEVAIEGSTLLLCSVHAHSLALTKSTFLYPSFSFGHVTATPNFTSDNGLQQLYDDTSDGSLSALFIVVSERQWPAHPYKSISSGSQSVKLIVKVMSFGLQLSSWLFILAGLHHDKSVNRNSIIIADDIK